MFNVSCKFKSTINHLMFLTKGSRQVLLIILILFVASVLFFMWSVRQSEPTTMYEATNVNFAQPQNFDNCIILNSDKAILIISKQKRNLNYASLENDLLKEVSNLNGEDFSIIMTRTSDYHVVNKVLAIISKGNVVKYKLLKA
jgi:biopolymer transport protein ExbD